MKHVVETLPVLVLDVYSRCNCRCVMCDIWKRDSVQKIDPDDLLRQLPAIQRLSVQWVVLTGGEPLMHPDLFRISNPLRALGIRVTLLTTGLLLDRYSESVAKNIDDVIVSLDGPAGVHDRIRRVPMAFERMSAGIKALRRQDGAFPISARSTVQRANCAHLRETMLSARSLGCDSVSFLAIDTHSTAFDHSPDRPAADLRLTLSDIEKLESEIESLIGSGECGRFILETPEKLRRIVDHARWDLGIGTPASPRCNAPWTSAVLEPDGTLRPCFFHRPVGRMQPGLELDRVLNNAEAVAFRNSLDVSSNAVCRQCVCSLNWKGPN